MSQSTSWASVAPSATIHRQCILIIIIYINHRLSPASLRQQVEAVLLPQKHTRNSVTQKILYRSTLIEEGTKRKRFRGPSDLLSASCGADEPSVRQVWCRYGERRGQMWTDLLTRVTVGATPSSSDGSFLPLCRFCFRPGVSHTSSADGDFMLQ